MRSTAPRAIIAPSPAPSDLRVAARLGWRIEARILRRDIRGSKHLLRQPPALAFDAWTFQRLRAHFDGIEVQDTEEGVVYRIGAHDFDRFAERLDRGHGLQDYVRLEHWERRQKDGQPARPGPFRGRGGLLGAS